MEAILPRVQNKIFEVWKHEGFQKYFKNTSWMMVAQIINVVATFFIGAWVTRYLGPEKIGILSFALSFTGIFVFLSSLGIDNIVYRDLVKRPEDEYNILGTSFLIRLLGGLSAFTITVVAVIMLQANDQVTQFITIIIASSFIMQSVGVIGLYFQSRVLSKINSQITIITVFLLSILRILFILLHLSLLWFALIFLLEQIFNGIGFFIMYRKLRRKVVLWSFDYGLARSILRDSLPLFLSLIFSNVNGRIDQVIMGTLMNKYSVGLYATMVKISEAWFFIPSIITSSLFPAIVNAKKTSEASFRNRLIKLYSLIIWISIGFVVLLLVFGGLAIKLLFGPQFISTIPLMRIYVFSCLGIPLSMVMYPWLIVENYTKIAFYCSVIGAVTNIVANLLLIPRFGIMGAIISSIISYYIIFLVLILFKKTRSHLILIFKGLTFNLI